MSDLVIRAHGYSIKLTSFARQQKEHVRRQKQRVEVVVGRLLAVWANEAVKLSRANTPEFLEGGKNPNSLTNSIVANEVQKLAHRMKVTVGIASSWESNYEEWFEDKYGKRPPWGVARPQLALFLHENWDDVAGPRAVEAAAAKEAKSGGRVGSHFLLRGVQEASDPRDIAVLAKKLFRSNVGRYKMTGTKFNTGDLPKIREEL